MTFKVGDRVRYISDVDFGDKWYHAEAVVARVSDRGGVIYVHFDDVYFEQRQSFEVGWPTDCFELIEDREHELINEDWS